MRPTLAERLAADPGASIATVAAAEGVTARAALEALPEGMCHFGDGGFFADAMKAIGRWGDVVLVASTPDGIVEVTGPVPEGKHARGAFTLSSRLGPRGRVDSRRCGGIAFIERPSPGGVSASVVFLDGGGELMFEVAVRRDPGGALQKEQLAAFRALREAIVAEHIDDDH